MIKSFFAIIILTFLFTSCNMHDDETIIYLVRHAEKDTTVSGDNPPLTQEGEERADLLHELLNKYDIKEIYSTEYDRNINTVKPLATAKDIKIKHYDWYDWQEVIDKIKNKKGIFVVCGHGDNLLPMIEYLNAEKPLSEIGHNDYENLFKVIIYKDTAYVDLINF